MPTSVSELEAMYGVGNPLAYGQAQEQQGLSNIVQQQEAAQAQQKTQANSLANMFTEANNPNLLRKNAADAEGQEFKNMSEGVKGRNSLATEGLQLDDEKRKYLLNASDNDLKMFANKAQQMAYSSNPEEAAKGAKLLQLSATAQQLRQNHTYEMEKQEVIRRSAEKIAAGNNAVSRENSIRSSDATRYAVDQRKAIAEAKASKGADIIAAAQTGKISYEKAATAFTILAETEKDPDQQATYASLAGKFEQANLNQKNAQAGSKPDMNQFGITPQRLEPALAPKAKPAQTDRVSVIDKNGQRGTIPRSQLQQALSSGFKEAK